MSENVRRAYSKKDVAGRRPASCDRASVASTRPGPRQLNQNRAQKPLVSGYIYIYVHLQPLQGDKEGKEANLEGLVLLFLSRFVFVKSKGT